MTRREHEQQIRRIQIAETLANSSSEEHVLIRIMNLQPHLQLTLKLDLDEWLKVKSPEITIAYPWIGRHNIRKIFNLMIENGL